MQTKAGREVTVAAAKPMAEGQAGSSPPHGVIPGSWRPGVASSVAEAQDGVLSGHPSLPFRGPPKREPRR